MLKYGQIEINEKIDNNLKISSGYILIDEDGWTEGIIKSKNSEGPTKRFVFGIFHRPHIIELYSVDNNNPSEVHKFYGARTFYLDKFYKGQSSIVQDSVEYNSKECDISAVLIEKDPRDLDTEKDDFIDRFKKWKQQEVTGKVKELYTSYLADKQALSDALIQKYNTLCNTTHKKGEEEELN